MALRATISTNNLLSRMYIYKQLPNASGNKSRVDTDAVALVKKLGLKVLATVSLVTYDPVWKSELFAALHA